MMGLLVFTVHTIRRTGYVVKYLYYLIYYFLRTKINFSIDILYELCQPFLTGVSLGAAAYSWPTSRNVYTPGTAGGM